MLAKRVICSTDFSAPSFEGVDMAARIAEHLGAELLLVHVMGLRRMMPQVAAPDAMPAVDVAVYLQDIIEDSQAQLEKLIAERVPKDLRARALVVEGDPAQEIAALADSRDADLIVIATHGVTGWRRWVFGSVAERVVRYAACPVLTVPAPEGAEVAD